MRVLRTAGISYLLAAAKQRVRQHGEQHHIDRTQPSQQQRHGETRGLPGAGQQLRIYAVVIKALRMRDGAMAGAAIRQEMGTEALRSYLTAHAERPEWARRSLPSPPS